MEWSGILFIDFTHPSLKRGPIVLECFRKISRSRSFSASMFSRTDRMGLTRSSRIDFGISDRHLGPGCRIGNKSDSRSEDLMAREISSTKIAVILTDD